MRLHTLRNGWKLVLMPGVSRTEIQMLNPEGTMVARFSYDNDGRYKADHDYAVLIEMYDTRRIRRAA